MTDIQHQKSHLIKKCNLSKHDIEVHDPKCALTKQTYRRILKYEIFMMALMYQYNQHEWEAEYLTLYGAMRTKIKSHSITCNR